MDKKSATILINKLGAAERQLNAAIRMVFRDEDELAIHTVAAAAYRVLRDIKHKRGRSDAFDLVSRGLFSVANDLATGKKHSIPKPLADSGLVIKFIESIRDGMVSGEIKGWEDLPPVTVHDERHFWKKFDAPFNFLKHANEDSKEMLDIGKINNDELLMRAVAVFVEITHRNTPEIEAFTFFILGNREDCDLPEELNWFWQPTAVAKATKVPRMARKNEKRRLA